jgi:hypothetical protein
MRLNGWQRLWVLTSVLLVIAMSVVLVAVWPSDNTSIIADIHSPTCKLWLNLPKGFFPDKAPEGNDQCYALQEFLFSEKHNVKSEAEYDMYVVRLRIKTVVVLLGVWLTTSLSIYLCGWSVGWVIKGFQDKA